MDTTLRDPLVGQVLDGRYRVGSRVARGGMATVYLGMDLRLDRPVALKVLHTHLAQDEEAVARFIQEAKSAARLSHPNVVAVYDQGRDGPTVFLAMEFIEGRTLRDVLRGRHPLRPREAFGVLEAVLAALGAAHAAGLVHRDVKPENVLLADDGRIKVADFGLARVSSATSTNSAAAGQFLATVGYVAPERVRGETADARSDVYSAGILLYEMLTGEQPFHGEDAVNVAFQHVNTDVPPPSARVPGLAADIDALVLRATSREPAVRPADATAFLRELHRVAQQLSEAELDGAEAGLRGEADQPTQRVALPGRHDTRVVTMPADGPLAGLAGLDGLDPGQAPEGLPPDGEPAARRSRRGVIILALLLLVAAALGVGGWWIGAGPGAWTSTPPVIDMTSAAAQAKIQAAGLTPQLRQAYSETVAAGHVISTQPPPNARVHRHGTVVVLLSRGKERYAAPKLSGMSEAQARAAITKDNLNVGQVSTAYSDTVPTGEVISQDPPAGTSLKRGTAVSFVLSRGPQPVQVPDVTGKTLAEATTTLGAVGLSADVTGQQFSDTVPKGVVISQDPSGGTLGKGSTVSLVVSKGPDLVTVPNVVGEPIAQATALLQSIGVKVNVVRAPFGSGRVYAQSVTGPVKRGSTVTLYVV